MENANGTKSRRTLDSRQTTHTTLHIHYITGTGTFIWLKDPITLYEMHRANQRTKHGKTQKETRTDRGLDSHHTTYLTNLTHHPDRAVAERVPILKSPFLRNRPVHNVCFKKPFLRNRPVHNVCFKKPFLRKRPVHSGNFKKKPFLENLSIVPISKSPGADFKKPVP